MIPFPLFGLCLLSLSKEIKMPLVFSFSNQMFPLGAFSVFSFPLKESNSVYLPELKGTSVRGVGEGHGTRVLHPQ